MSTCTKASSREDALDAKRAPATQGERLTRLDLDQVEVLRCRYGPRIHLESHVHEHASIVLVTAGAYVERVASSDYPMAPGSVLLKPAGEVHEDRFGDAGAESMIVVLPMRIGDERLWGATVVQSVNHFTDGPVTALATRIHRELQGGDDLSGLIVEGLVREIVGVATRRDDHGPSSAPPWLRRIHERIRDEYTGSVTVQDLADEEGIHPDYLSRRFKAEYGIVIGEFVRRLRVDHAAEALQSSDQSISGIAHATGFVDQSHLTRVFKRYLGLTPGRYRAQSRLN